MNPYRQLSRIAGVFSHRAKLTKSDRRVFDLFVKPEQKGTEEFQKTTVSAALVVREWTCAVEDLTTDGAFSPPAAGDVLTVFSDDETAVKYDCARDSVSGRYWDWQYLRPGYRVKFYTKYNPKEAQA